MSHINFGEPHPAIGKTIKSLSYSILSGGRINIQFTDDSSLEVFNEKQFRACYCPPSSNTKTGQSVTLQLEKQSYYSAGTFYTVTDDGVEKYINK